MPGGGGGEETARLQAARNNGNSGDGIAATTGAAAAGYHQPNPLLVAIVEAAETLGALAAKGQLKADDVAGARALIALRADKVGLGVSVTQGYGLVVARQEGSPSGWCEKGCMGGDCCVGLYMHLSLLPTSTPPRFTTGRQTTNPSPPAAPHTPKSTRSPPLPLKVDGFSLGAVAGYSEQRTVVTLGSDADAAVFLADKRSLKMGLDLGLSLGKKVNRAASVAHDTVAAAMKPAAMGGGAQPRPARAFTISKCASFCVCEGW
jgi:hypothetical protein